MVAALEAGMTRRSLRMMRRELAGMDTLHARCTTRRFTLLSLLLSSESKRETLNLGGAVTTVVPLPSLCLLRGRGRGATPIGATRGRASAGDL